MSAGDHPVPVRMAAKKVGKKSNHLWTLPAVAGAIHGACEQTAARRFQH